MSWVEMHGWGLNGKVICEQLCSGMGQFWSGVSLSMTPSMRPKENPPLLAVLETEEQKKHQRGDHHADTPCYVTEPKKMPSHQGLVHISGWYCLVHDVTHGHWKTQVTSTSPWGEDSWKLKSHLSWTLPDAPLGLPDFHL